MFFPIVEEKDVYDEMGVQVNDVNSVVEYIVHDVFLKNKKKAPSHDEDNDQPHYFHLHKGIKKLAPVVTVLPLQAICPRQREFATLDIIFLPEVSSDIIIPPPKA